MLITDYVIILLAFMAFDYMGLSLVLGPRFQRMAQHINRQQQHTYVSPVLLLVYFLIFLISFD